MPRKQVSKKNRHPVACPACGAAIVEVSERILYSFEDKVLVECACGHISQWEHWGNPVKARQVHLAYGGPLRGRRERRKPAARTRKSNTLAQAELELIEVTS